MNLRKNLLQLSHACGLPHPALVDLDHFEILDDRFGARSAREVFGYLEPGGRLGPDLEAQLRRDLSEVG